MQVYKTLLCNDYACNTISQFNLLKLDLQTPSYVYSESISYVPYNYKCT